MNKHWKIFDYSDIHTHVGSPDSVLSVNFTTDPLPADTTQAFTLGVHPWNAGDDVDWEAFENVLADNRVVGIGEAGLDSLRGPDMEIQLKVFDRQIALAEKHSLPLVIHSVRNNHRILELMKRHNPSVPWIIHGFRGKPEEARRLLEAGLHLSLGAVHNLAVTTLPYPTQIHHETDREQQ